jgi:hypothetical protein
VKVFFAICLLLLFAFGCASDRLPRERAVTLARAQLSEERRAAFPDVTEVVRKDHVQSWMVIFENRKRDDGVWVMIDDKGQFVDAGHVYADH